MEGRRIQVLNVPDYIGEASVDITFFYFDGGLDSVIVSFESKDFSTLEIAFRERFGQPHSERKPLIKTSIGAVYENHQLVWKGPTITVDLYKYSGKIGDGLASIGKLKAYKFLENSKREKAKAAAKDL